MLRQEMKEFRLRHGLSTRAAGKIIGCTGEAYRLKERDQRISGAELAKLAAAFGETVATAFPSYRPTEGERLLVEQLRAA